MQIEDVIFKRDEMRHLMINKYGEICFANYDVSRINPLEQHHIKKVVDGGKTTMNNIVMITHIPHSIINALDCNCQVRKLKEINEALQYYKECRNNIIRRQVYHYLEAERVAMGYDIVDNGKILVLKRK